MIKVKFTEEDIESLNYERYHNPHPRVQRKKEALWLKSQGEPNKKIAQLTGISINVVTKYIKEYQTGGIGKLKELNFYRPESTLSEHKQTIEDYFRGHPPATIKEAMNTIESLTGLKRSEPQVAKFLRKIGLRHRKVGAIPSKANVDEQETFSKNPRPRSQRGQGRKRSGIFYRCGSFCVSPFFRIPLVFCPNISQSPVRTTTV